VENIPDFDSFVEVWIALFGRSESQSIAGICKQFWQSDWTQNFARRAIFDVARSRFPIQLRPLLKLLRAMTAAGFLDTDTLSTADHSHEGEELDQDRDLCERHVFYYLDKLPTYSQIIRTSACTGSHALYETAPERYGASIPSPGLTYTNLKPIKLPGGTILPARSSGRLLTGDGGDFIVVGWNHQHSGWKVILEVLTNYIYRKCVHASNRGSYPDVSFHRVLPTWRGSAYCVSPRRYWS
jgi:nuclear pore complex protein Nup188